MYTAGVLDEMLRDGLRFDYSIGVSAGATNLVTYVAGQLKRNFRFYYDHIRDPRFMGIRSLAETGDYFGLEYIYATMTNEGGGDPLDYDALMRDPMEYVLGATDMLSGREKYFTKNDLVRNNYLHLMATSCIPVLCRPVIIDGRPYCDGGVADSIPAQKALDDGCDRLVIVLMRPAGFVKQPEKHRRIYSRRLRNYPETVKALDRRHIMYMEELKLCEKLRDEGRAVLIRPKEALPVTTTTHDPEKILPLYDMGIADYREARYDIQHLFARDLR